jgi:hypothetical protein
VRQLDICKREELPGSIVAFFTCQSECWTESLRFGVLNACCRSTVRGKPNSPCIRRHLAAQVLLIESDGFVAKLLRRTLIRMVGRRGSSVTISSAVGTNCGMLVAAICSRVSGAGVRAEGRSWVSRGMVRVSVGEVRVVGKPFLLLFFHARNIA